MQAIVSTDSPAAAESGRITVSVYVSSIVGVFTLGILMGSLLGAVVMKLSFKFHKQIAISNQENTSKYIIRSQNDATCYEEIVLADNSSGIDLSHNVAYGEVKKN